MKSEISDKFHGISKLGFRGMSKLKNCFKHQHRVTNGTLTRLSADFLTIFRMSTFCVYYMIKMDKLCQKKVIWGHKIFWLRKKWEKSTFSGFSGCFSTFSIFEPGRARLKRFEVDTRHCGEHFEPSGDGVPRCPEVSGRVKNGLLISKIQSFQFFYIRARESPAE